jgi:GntR family transcriptional repressor for pyruvate dehydrogenase complex
MANIVRPTDLAIYTVDDMLQVIHVRRIIEGETVYLAAGLRTQIDLDNIRAALNQMMVPGISPGDAAKHDLAFHLAIAKTSKNKMLTSILHAILGSLYQAILLALNDESDKTRAIAEHEQILNAIESQQAERARRLMVEHFRIVERKVRTGVVPVLGRDATGDQGAQ